MNEEKNGIDTKLSNKKLYKRFVIPALLIQIFSGILQLGDRIIGALFIGENILAVVTLVFPVLMFGISIAVMIMVGLGIEINFLLGKKENKKAQGISTFVVIFASIISIIITILLLLFNNNIVNAIVQTDILKELSSKYLNYISLTFPPLAIGYTLSTIIIADDSPRYNMIGQFILSIGNVLLNILFVVIFKMGIEGLGMATLISSSLFLLYNLSYFLFKFNKTFKVIKPIIDFKELGKILYNGVSEFASIGSYGFSMLVLNYIITKEIGTEFFIAYSMFSIISSLYINARYGGINGISPIISKTLGEERISKGLSLTRYSFIITSMVCLAFYSLLYFVIEPISKSFVTEQITIKYIKEIYLTYGLVLLLGIIADFASGFLTAIKKPLHSLLVSGIKPLILTPIIVSVGIIVFGKSGLLIGALIVEVIYLPLLYFMIKNIIKNILEKHNNNKILDIV